MNKLSLDILSYSPSVIKGFSFNQIREYAESSIDQKNYIALRYLLENTDPNKSIFASDYLNHAIEKLDIEAVKILIDISSKSKSLFEKNAEYINERLLYNLFEDNFDYILLELNEETRKERQHEILKLLFNAMPKDSFTKYNVQKIIDHFSQQEFEDLCKTKELDLTEEKFEGLDLSVYKYENTDPVQKLDENHNLIDLILSRTYSDDLGIDKIKDIYSKLYHLDPIAKEMMTLVAVLISQNNNIKIIFEEGAESSYHYYKNIIKIDTKFIQEPVFNIESVTIHEIGHFIYHALYNSDATPFSKDSVKEFLTSLVPKYKEYKDDEFEDGTAKFLIYNQENIIKNLFNITKKMGIDSYESAAKKPIDKAAELLNINSSEYDKYIFTNEYCEYFKFNSPIDLFFQNSQIGFAFEAKNTSSPKTQASHDVFHNMAHYYYAEHTYCSISDNNNTAPFQEIYKDATDDRSEIIRWSIEDYLPKIIIDLGLFNSQIHFLERIADYVNRGLHKLQDHSFSSFMSDDNEKYAELIVRSMELKASGISEDADLIKSFHDIELWHIKHVSPDICKIFIDNEAVATLAWDDNEVCALGIESVCLEINS